MICDSRFMIPLRAQAQDFLNAFAIGKTHC